MNEPTMDEFAKSIPVDGAWHKSPLLPGSKFQNHGTFMYSDDWDQEAEK